MGTRNVFFMYIYAFNGTKVYTSPILFVVLKSTHSKQLMIRGAAASNFGIRA